MNAVECKIKRVSKKCGLYGRWNDLAQGSRVTGFCNVSAEALGSAAPVSISLTFVLPSLLETKFHTHVEIGKLHICIP
jgi:hypothetical protein